MTNIASKLFCILPLLFALLVTGMIVPGTAQEHPPFDNPKSKEESKECIEEIERKQARIKEEMRKIKKMIKRNR